MIPVLWLVRRRVPRVTFCPTMIVKRPLQSAKYWDEQNNTGKAKIVIDGSLPLKAYIDRELGQTAYMFMTRKMLLLFTFVARIPFWILPPENTFQFQLPIMSNKLTLQNCPIPIITYFSWPMIRMLSMKHLSSFRIWIGSIWIKGSSFGSDYLNGCVWASAGVFCHCMGSEQQVAPNISSISSECSIITVTIFLSTMNLWLVNISHVHSTFLLL